MYVAHRLVARAALALALTLPALAVGQDLIVKKEVFTLPAYTAVNGIAGASLGAIQPIEWAVEHSEYFELATDGGPVDGVTQIGLAAKPIAEFLAR